MVLGYIFGSGPERTFSFPFYIYIIIFNKIYIRCIKNCEKKNSVNLFMYTITENIKTLLKYKVALYLCDCDIGFKLCINRDKMCSKLSGKKH